MWDDFLISTTWFGVPLIKSKDIFIESALADLFPAGVYDRASTTALIYTSMKLSDNENYWHQNFLVV